MEKFRPTLWPGEVIAPPRVVPAEEVEVVDEEWVTWLRGPAKTEARHLPDEFYLREMQGFDFHTRDVTSAASLIAEFGVLCEDDYQEWAGGEYYNWDARGIAAEMRRSYKGKYPQKVINPGNSLNLLEAVTHFDAIRFLREAWIECASTGSMADYAAMCRVPEEETRKSFLEVLNAGLKLAHARAINPEAPEELATIYGVCCLQVYNHIAEGARYKRCANESCRQVFVRQRGRAQHGHHKSDGVKFCTRECARAQAQRELRRRKKYGDAADDVTVKIQYEIERAERRFRTVSTNTKLPSLGANLKKVREKAGLSLDEMAELLHVSTMKAWLENFEAGDLAEFFSGSEFKIRGYIREWAFYAGVDPAPLLKQYERERLPEDWDPGRQESLW